MSIDVQLGNYNAFKWENKTNTYVIGHAIYNDKLLHEKELLKLIDKITTEDELTNTVKQLNGAFSIIKINKDGKIYLITDIVGSFPILYQINDNNILISDDINKFKNKTLNNTNIEELLALRVCSNNKTLYNEIFQVPSATITTINNNNVKENIYFEYKVTKVNTKGEKEIFQEMYELYDKAVKRLIEFANGKKIVVPLSGGYDSRLILCHLRKNNYNNVVCYSYGRKNNPEYISASKVSKELNYPFYFVEYKSKEMQTKYYNKEEYSKMADYFGRGKVLPIIQEWIAIDKLINKGIIDKECIVAPGFLGDFLNGSEIKNDELTANEYNTTNNLKDYILKKSYGWHRYNDNLKKKFTNEISNTLNIKFNDEKVKVEKIIELLEVFDLRERESKYIANAVRVYEYYGLKWYLVYTDKCLMEYFKNANQIAKIDRKLYKKYVATYYKDLLEKAPIAVKKSDIRSAKTYKNFITKNLNRIRIVLFSYHDNIINFYGYFKVKDYLKNCF